MTNNDSSRSYLPECISKAHRYIMFVHRMRHFVSCIIIKTDRTNCADDSAM